jgi:hypothetical protein
MEHQNGTEKVRERWVRMVTEHLHEYQCSPARWRSRPHFSAGLFRGRQSRNQCRLVPFRGRIHGGCVTSAWRLSYTYGGV